MQIVTGINPNCSEATIRINTTKVPKETIRKLVDKLTIECSYSSEPGDWDDSNNIRKEFDWGEASVYTEKIFGIPCVIIKGDAPYNNGEEVREIIKRYIKDPTMEED